MSRLIIVSKALIHFNRISKCLIKLLVINNLANITKALMCKLMVVTGLMSGALYYYSSEIKTSETIKQQMYFVASTKHALLNNEGDN